jgi:hypothetical protein
MTTTISTVSYSGVASLAPLVLPEEVVIDEAEAQEKHGMLEIRLPKLDKHRSTQLKVRSNVNNGK